MSKLESIKKVVPMRNDTRMSGWKSLYISLVNFSPWCFVETRKMERTEQQAEQQFSVLSFFLFFFIFYCHQKYLVRYKNHEQQSSPQPTRTVGWIISLLERDCKKNLKSNNCHFFCVNRTSPSARIWRTREKLE